MHYSIARHIQIKNYAAFVLYFALRGNNISVTKMSKMLTAVDAETLPMKKIKLPNCSHSINTRHA
jgi:hypothetical protein